MILSLNEEKVLNNTIPGLNNSMDVYNLNFDTQLI